MKPHFVTHLMTAAAMAAAVPALGLALAAAGAGDKAIHIPGDLTRAAFAKGQPLVETAGYKVHASRRDAPGLAEVHTEDTDIIYVLDGTATIVTGGTMVSRTEIAPHEIRGKAIEGGTAQQLARGDVFIVPNGVPHWFTDVQAPFLYYVVKTTSLHAAAGAR
jgi:quercetin dioxygenase-like cupin family protein